MARKRKSRLTHKKKSTGNPDKAPPEGLSKRQFAALEGYTSFVAPDSEGEQHTFGINDTVYIKPYATTPSEAIPDEDYWIGKVRDIRANGPDDVWVRVQWYWSPQEVAEVIKSFHPEFCGKYEKLFSDNHDIVSSRCFAGHIHVEKYDERNIHQPFIGEGDYNWFYRYTFEYNAKRIIPKVATVTCICGVPYIPGVDDILHFCPRPGCRTAHHQTCLLERGFVEDLSEERCRRLIETWPSVGTTVTETVDSLANMNGPPRKRRKGENKTVECPVLRDDPLEGFPEELITVARQQIVKGTKAGGIVGNVTAVTAARDLIYETLSKDGIVPDDWKTVVDIDSAFLDDHQTLPGLLCPFCGSPI
ncbi:hypothetical protein BU15DRAFT_74901 [Melanogaster broomeanus]|nr:hypothetical protein BU15DRAFT_74901 [Melanogaster broomeanus]